MKYIKRTTFIVVICCVLGITGWNLSNRSHDATRLDDETVEVNNVAEDAVMSDDVDTYRISTSALLTMDIRNAQEIADDSSNIALVRIDSIDGANNYSEVINDYVYPYTYGKMTILENIKGNLAINEQVEFYRMGGTLSIEQYRASLSEDEQEIFDTNLKNDPSLMSVEQIDVRFTDDIEPIAGKTYLVYLKPEESRYAKPNTYGITGLQGGLREVQFIEKTAKSVPNAKVLNNFTGEWENLGEIIMSTK